MDIDGTGLSVPVTLIGGRAPGPRVLVTTGLHGSEFPATAAVMELTQALEPDSVSGRLILIHPFNTQAFRARVSMILPEDGQNINRMFPGDPRGQASARAAWWLTRLSDEADFYLDLHSGDLYEDLTPYAYYPGNAAREVVEKSKKAALVLDLPYLVKSSASTGAYNSAALRGTPALLIERGGAGRCSRPDIDAYKKDLVNVFKHLRVLPGEPEPVGCPLEMERVVYLESEGEASWLAEVSPGQRLAKGQVLGRVMDFFGRVIREYRAEMDGIVLYQLQALSTNRGDVLVAYGAPRPTVDAA